MKCIVIFKDKKGFTKIVEFVSFPSEYRFVEYEGVKVVKYDAIAEISPAMKETTFIPYGSRTEVGGQIIQEYRSI